MTNRYKTNKGCLHKLRRYELLEGERVLDDGAKIIDHTRDSWLIIDEPCMGTPGHSAAYHEDDSGRRW